LDRFSEVSQIFPHFALKSKEREVKSPCFYYVWWALDVTQHLLIVITYSTNSSSLIYFTATRTTQYNRRCPACTRTRWWSCWYSTTRVIHFIFYIYHLQIYEVNIKSCQPEGGCIPEGKKPLEGWLFEFHLMKAITVLLYQNYS